MVTPVVVPQLSTRPYPLGGSDCGPCSGVEALYMMSNGGFNINDRGRRIWLVEEIRSRGGEPYSGATGIAGISAGVRAFAPEFSRAGYPPPRVQLMWGADFDSEFLPALRARQGAMISVIYSPIDQYHSHAISGDRCFTGKHGMMVAGTYHTDGVEWTVLADPLADGRYSGSYCSPPQAGRVVHGPVAVPISVIREAMGLYAQSWGYSSGHAMAGVFHASVSDDPPDIFGGSTLEDILSNGRDHDVQIGYDFVYPPKLAAERPAYTGVSQAIHVTDDSGGIGPGGNFFDTNNPNGTGPNATPCGDIPYDGDITTTHHAQVTDAGVFSYGPCVGPCDVSCAVTGNIPYLLCGCAIGCGGWSGVSTSEAWYEVPITTMDDEWTALEITFDAGGSIQGVADGGDFYVGWAHATPSALLEWINCGRVSVNDGGTVMIPRNFINESETNYLVVAPTWVAEDEFFACAQKLESECGGPVVGGEGNSGAATAPNIPSAQWIKICGQGSQRTDWTFGDGAVDGINEYFSLIDWTGEGSVEARIGAVVLADDDFELFPDTDPKQLRFKRPPPENSIVAFKYNVDFNTQPH